MQTKKIPQFFAGRLYTEDDVDGGTGDTPNEAVADYFANHADDEINWSDTEDDQGTFTLEIYEVHPIEKNQNDEEDRHDFELGACLEKREFHWRREPDPAFPDLDRIIYAKTHNS